MVVDGSGRPVPGASVEALSGPDGRPNWSGVRDLVDQTESTPDGEFQLDVYAGSFKLRGRAAGFVAASLLEIPAGRTGVELRLIHGTSLQGLVIGPVGEPLAAVEVASQGYFRVPNAFPVA